MDKAGDILKSFLSFYEIEKGDAYCSFFSSWKEIVGEDLASHARTVDIRKNSLLVEVDHPGWMQLLQLRQSKILKAMERRYPELGLRSIHMRLVKNAFFSSGAVSETSEERKEPAARKDEAPETENRTAGIEAIQDDALKGLLLRLRRSIAENDAAKRKKVSGGTKKGLKE